MTKQFIQQVATLEIPVSNIRKAVQWYETFIGTIVLHESQNDAMLRLPGEVASSAPTLYLLETASGDSLSFSNTSNGVSHGIIDFYVPQLAEYHSYLQKNGVSVTGLHYFEGTQEQGGFGFSDPDGNRFGATNITHGT